MNVLAVCAGIGGLEAGLKQAVPTATCVCYVEREAYPAAVLVERMDVLGVAPIWSDVATFDGTRWRGVVDCIAAGFPCQPFSVAGSRRGLDDERWIWPDIARIIREVGPRLVFVENVPGLFAAGLARVLGDLHALGFDAEWDCVPAAAVGAPHLRDRLFALAYADPQRLPIEREFNCSEGGDDAERFDSAGGGRLFADSYGARLAQWEEQHREQRPTAERGHRSDYWRRVPAPPPGVRRVDAVVPHRVDRIAAIGNSVCPQAAALAFRHLWGRAMTAPALPARRPTGGA